jgi:hypothetical protein
MDRRIPALPRPDTSDGKTPTQIGHIWGLAGTMAAERSQTERGRRARTYLYASAFFGVIFLVVLGASLLLVIRTMAMACSGIAHLLLHPFRRVRHP